MCVVFVWVMLGMFCGIVAGSSPRTVTIWSCRRGVGAKQNWSGLYSDYFMDVHYSFIPWFWAIKGNGQQTQNAPAYTYCFPVPTWILECTFGYPSMIASDCARRVLRCWSRWPMFGPYCSLHEPCSCIETCVHAEAVEVSQSRDACETLTFVKKLVLEP